MSKNEDKSRQIDLSGFSDDQIQSLYRYQQRGVRRQGYDDSDDVTVDYTPTAQDAINASKIVASDYDFGDWKDVREALPGSYSDEDAIFKMRGAVGKEFLKRQENRLSGMEGNIAGNSTSIEELQAMQNKVDPELQDPEQLTMSTIASNAKSGVDTYDAQLQNAGDFLVGRKDGVKQVLKDNNVPTRGSNSPFKGTGLTFSGVQLGGGPTQTEPKPPSNAATGINLRQENSPSSFLSDYKMGLANQLAPAQSRSSAVQSDKDKQKIHAQAQQPIGTSSFTQGYN